jgi:hypothetical protein
MGQAFAILASDLSLYFNGVLRQTCQARTIKKADQKKNAKAPVTGMCNHSHIAIFNKASFWLTKGMQFR